MRKRILFFLIICFVNMIMCTGCWNYREIDKLSIAAGVAIDKTQDGKIKITTEVVDLHEGGRDVKIKSKKLESYGDTLFDAIRNTIKITAARLYWGHTEIVIFSQDVAKEGIADIIDFLARDAEPRQSMDLLISKEKTAEEILDLQSTTTEIRSYEINEMLDTQRGLSKVSKVQIHEFINALSDEGISAVMPVVGATTNDGGETLELSGTAVFKQDKLVYMLDGEETKSLLFVIDKIKGGLLVVKDNSNSGQSKITLEILKSDTKVKPIFSDGKVSIDVNVKTKVTAGQSGEKEKTLDENKSLSLQKDAEKMLKTDMVNVIKKVQQDVDADIFGFGKAVRKDMPALWRKIGPEWNEIFKNLEVNVITNIKIQNSGLMSKPIKVGD